ncbi:hypothetical protein GUJ93_ZPchr0014g47331 [Zizania palustris]|uniref:Uncharacterized protein n=1 Tax=Zizania palustris TaxID=103762 RepID=A0A8J5SUK9_ZIZPA|nr:hypothetical protein GUJ93_ZPchr0014g47331 [Zizania palustris]
MLGSSPSHQCGVVMGRPKQALKRDNFRRCGVVKIEANSGSSTSRDNYSTSDSGTVYEDNLDEKLDALVARVEGFTSTNTQRRMSLADQLDLVNKKLDALVVKLDGLTDRNTQRRMSLAGQLDIVNKKLDIVIKKLGTK